MVDALAGNYVLQAYSFDETDWTTLGNSKALPAIASGLVQIASLSSTLVVVAFTGDGKLYTYSFDGTDWSLYGSTFVFADSPGSSIGNIVSLSATRIAMFVGVDQDLFLCELEGGSWSQRTADFTIAASFGRMARLSGTRIAFTDPTADTLRTYDLATTWTDIDTQAASANDEWEELSLTVTTDADTYDGYRLLVDSSEEYYVFRVTALLSGYANVNGSALRIPATASNIFHNTEHNGNHRRFGDLAKRDGFP